MMQGMAKLKENTTEGTTCVNPTVGEAQVAAYIAGELDEAARRAFVAHLPECTRCLKAIVLWHMLKELAESEGDQPSRAAQTAEG